MAVVQDKTSALAVPYAVEQPDRIPKERYFDPDFFALEVERLWSRTWQMACRLEEIPEPRDFVEYQFLDQSVIVVRALPRICAAIPPQAAAARRTTSPSSASLWAAVRP